MKITDKKHLEKLYAKLEIKEADPNRINFYQCTSGQFHFTKTIDRNYGVTPMYISCHKCGSTSASSFYNNLLPDEKITHEWYVPTLEETWGYVKSSPLMVDHILNGGLLMREIKDGKG